jgi:hypothetical protein
MKSQLKMRFKTALAISSLFLSSLLFVFTLGNAADPTLQADTPPIFEEVSVDTRAIVRTEALRSRLARLDVTRIAPGTASPGARFTMNLFDNLALNVVTRRHETLSLIENGFAWIADIEGDPNGEAVLVVGNRHVEGYVNHGGRLFRVTTTEDGYQVIHQIDSASVMVDDAVMLRQPGETTFLPDTAYVPSNNPIIDVMVVYTPASRSAYGGTNAIINGIHAMVIAANLSFERSGIGARLRLVHTAETSYSASGNPYLDLRRLTNANADGSQITGPDGFMDEVPLLRNQYGADLVTGIIEINQPNGIAWQLQAFDAYPGSPFSEFAYNVIGSNLITGGLGFTHEIGHLLGNSHNREDASALGVFKFSHGYRDPGYFRTIMAYRCSSPLSPCPLVNIWSNPSLNYNGRPTGNPDINTGNNEVVTINYTADIAAAFRGSAVSVPPTPVPPFVANDWWTTAVQITQTPASFSQSVTGSTIASDPNMSCGTTPRTNGVWYQYTPPASQTVIFNTSGSTFDTMMTLFEMGINGLSAILCNDDISQGVVTSSVLLVNLTGGRTYYLQIGAKGTVPLTSPNTLRLNVNRQVNSGTEMIANGSFGAAAPSNPNLPLHWSVFASPGSDLSVHMDYRISGGVFEFLRKPFPPSNLNSAALLQNTASWLPAGAPIEIEFDLGNNSAQRKRISVLAHAADFSDLQVCTFWLTPNSPLRRYRMQTFTQHPWMPAALSFYASTADGTGWYRIDNVSMRYVPTASTTRTICTDPNTPPLP